MHISSGQTYIILTEWSYQVLQFVKFTKDFFIDYTTVQLLNHELLFYENIPYFVPYLISISYILIGLCRVNCFAFECMTL